MSVRQLSLAPARFGRLVIPFVNSHPLTDLHLVVILLPLWWVLGAEQFAAPLILSYSTLKLFLRYHRVIVGRPLTLLLLFIATSIISALFIVEPFRIVTLIRNLSMYFLAAFVLLIVTTTVKTWQQVKHLLTSMAYAMGMAATLGVLGILGVARPTFVSLVGRVLPGWITSRGYGEAIAQRQIGNVAWFAGLGNYFRVDSFFLFSTMYAAALAIIIPVVLFLAWYARSWQRWSLLVITVFMVINLIFTTGRMAMLSLALATLYYLVRHRRPFISAITLVLAVGGVVIAALLLPVGEVYSRAEEALYARGQGSVVSRTTIYLKTLEGVRERPIFGWGTERDITEANFQYPAGSHSYYLGTLYKQGSVGLVIFLALAYALWRSTTLPRRAFQKVKDQCQARAFLAVSRWSLLTAGLISFTSVLDLDASLMLYLWIVIACAAATKRLLLYGDASVTAEPGAQ
jgi:O-antigen ligase